MERLHHLNQHESPLCVCDSGEAETYKHLFFQCQMNRESGQSLLRCVQSYARDLNEERALRLEFTSDEPFLLASVSILATGLEFIWENRKLRKSTTLFTMRAELESSISIKRRFRLSRVREAARIMQNMVENFLN